MKGTQMSSHMDFFLFWDIQSSVIRTVQYLLHLDPRDAETLPVWFENLLLGISTAATFEACVVPCGYLPLFVRGFLCCILLGSLAFWVTLVSGLGSYPFSFLSGYGRPSFWVPAPSGLNFW